MQYKDFELGNIVSFPRILEDLKSRNKWIIVIGTIDGGVANNKRPLVLVCIYKKHYFTLDSI